MRFYNIIDERGRFCGLKIEKDGRDGQCDTHTYSYFYCRQMFRESGSTPALDRDLSFQDRPTDFIPLRKQKEMILSGSVQDLP